MLLLFTSLLPILIRILPTDSILTVCNKNTSFECECSDCGLDIGATIDWLVVHFNDCPPQLDEKLLRSKIANWINEECGAVLDCHLETGMAASNIVIGEFSCEPSNRQLAIVALRNSSRALESENLLEASLVGLVLQSREHLMAYLLHSELDGVVVQRRIPKPRRPDNLTVNIWIVVLTSMFILLLLLIAAIVYFSQIYINWRRVVKGRWSNRQYSKVPNVRFSVDSTPAPSRQS